MNLIHDMSLEITILKLQPYLPGANELNNLRFLVAAVFPN